MERTLKWGVPPVRRGLPSDAPALADRVVQQLQRSREFEPLLSATVRRRELSTALTHAIADTWVDESGGTLHGHLCARLLEDSSGELTAYSGPDAVSFESVGVLAHLLTQVQPSWRVRGALRHSVWTSLEDYRAWTGLGYEPVAVSLAREWMPHTRVTPPHDVSVRPALTSDLPVLRELDHEIDRAQGEEFDDSAEERLRELLEDPEVTYLVATLRDEVVAQVVTWDLGNLVGYPRHTLHVSDLAVRREARRLGVATYLISESVRRHPHPVRLVEARSRVSNAGAVAFWNRLGCRTLFVQVERALD